MPPIPITTIPPPQAWTAADLPGGKAALVREASPAVLAALDAAAPRLRDRPFPQVTRADLSDPAVVALMDAVRADVMAGRGLCVVAGIDPGRWAPSEFERLYWALGAHLGAGVVQSAFGDFVARVEKNPLLPFRGTTSDVELRPHTDFHELMSLASVALPVSGGVSGFVSSLGLHNQIAAVRPDLLAPLYEGWWNVSLQGRRLLPRKVPIYCRAGGQVSCFFNRVFWATPEEAGEAMPPELQEAVALMDEIAARPMGAPGSVRADFLLEPGEIAFWHNFLVMHSRTQFADAPGRKRLLHRLWLNVPEGGRPMAEEFLARGADIDRAHVSAQIA
jgi:hypothetical protein